MLPWIGAETVLDLPPRPWLHIAPEVWGHGAGGPTECCEAAN
jgi:hypothetical protein